MEFISRAFGAFLALFFDDFPFPLDDPSPVPQVSNLPKTPAFSRVEVSIFVTPNFERRWNPRVTSTPKIHTHRLFCVPERVEVVPEVRAPPVVAPLPLEGYLLRCKAVNGVKPNLNQVSVKRMGLRV